jgi:hypothetical protein
VRAHTGVCLSRRVSPGIDTSLKKDSGANPVGYPSWPPAVLQYQPPQGSMRVMSQWGDVWLMTLHIPSRAAEPEPGVGVRIQPIQLMSLLSLSHLRQRSLRLIRKRLRKVPPPNLAQRPAEGCASLSLTILGQQAAGLCCHSQEKSFSTRTGSAS